MDVDRKTGVMKTLPSFHESTAAYEKWLESQLTIVPKDLTRKHMLMASDEFMFFRATFYRWSHLYPTVCRSASRAAVVLAVGDLHVENFGTWRDTEGRLAWGINDFDEAAPMPWTIDLVRLAASAALAIRSEKLQIQPRAACAAIVAGYEDGLRSGGRPWVMAGHHHWLRSMVHPGLRDPAQFWLKFSSLPPYNSKVPKAARRGLERMLPGKNLDCQYAHRVAGLGSLGRERFVATAEFEGGLVCREAKSLAPSAWTWAAGKPAREIHYQEILDRSIRAHDPFVRQKGSWIVRRLAPDCTRIELAMFPEKRDESRLMHAMGFEIANIHLGSEESAPLLRQLKRYPTNWLHDAAHAMLNATSSDWQAWRGISRASAGA